MTKNKVAICTPMATREEFESILRELDGVGVTWKSGGVPTANKNYWENSNSKLSYNWYGEKELTMSGAGLEQLPRAEFIAAIKRDFAPKIDCSYPTEIKEQPKMNYNKMTKAELIAELKIRNYQMDKKEKDWSRLVREHTLFRGQIEELKNKIAPLENANAEQAETIAELKGASKSDSVVIGNLKDSLVEANREFRRCAKETARVKRILAQANADVLEGK